MSFLSSKINPFCSFTINLGPLYVERVLDSLLIKRGITNVNSLSTEVRYNQYLLLLNIMARSVSRVQYPVVLFYKAFFFEQSASITTHDDNKAHFQEKALCYYQAFVEIATKVDESRYFALWQIGILQDKLNYPWLETEMSLLNASSIDPIRGEAYKAIIAHYVRNKQWKTAHKHSLIAKNNYAGKNPAATRQWFVDFTFYDSWIIDTHLTICYELGYMQEAHRVSDQINVNLHATAPYKTAPEFSEF